MIFVNLRVAQRNILQNLIAALQSDLGNKILRQIVKEFSFVNLVLGLRVRCWELHLFAILLGHQEFTLGEFLIRTFFHHFWFILSVGLLNNKIETFIIRLTILDS